MRLFRRSIHLWLGLKALGLMASVIGFLLLVSKEHIGFNSARLIATLVGALALDVSSGIAWYSLRKGKASGRAWALTASACALLPSCAFLAVRPGNYPLAIFGGGFLGLAGLVAFWAKNSPLDVIPSPKKSRLLGDGTSQLKDYLGQALAMAIIWVTFQLWNQWAAAHGLAHPGLISYLVQFHSAVLLSTFIHEMGHLTAGWASGKILRGFRVGPFWWSVRHGKWMFQLKWKNFYGGGVSMAPRDLRHVRSSKVFLLLGGPVSSLLFSLIFTALTFRAVGHAWQAYWSLLSSLGTLCFAGFFVNMIPLQPESQYSDGAQLYQLVTNGPWARVHLAFAIVTTSVVAQVRPRDFNVDVLREAADFIRRGERGLLLRLNACRHYLDNNSISEALVQLQEAEGLYEECRFERPQDICAEFAFINAFFKRDADAAGFWWRRLEALPAIDQDCDYWRARASILWLTGDRSSALEAWQRGTVLAHQLPPVGAYAFTRSCFARMRTAMQNNDPQPLWATIKMLRLQIAHEGSVAPYEPSISVRWPIATTQMPSSAGPI